MEPPLKISGSSIGVTTDANGNFSINASKGETLEISYIGKTDETVVIGDNPVINVTLEDQTASSLNDVVVVGYGTQVKKDLTGSIGVVSQSKMDNQATVGNWSKSSG